MSKRLEFSLSDAIMAEEQVLEVLKGFNQVSEGEKQKVKNALIRAIKKTKTLKQTYICALYRKTYQKLETLTYE